MPRNPKIPNFKSNSKAHLLFDFKKSKQYDAPLIKDIPDHKENKKFKRQKNQLGISGLEFRLPQFADLNLFFPILFFFKAASFLGVQ